MKDDITGYSGISSRRLAMLLEAFIALDGQNPLSGPLLREYNAIKKERVKRKQGHRQRSITEVKGEL